MNTRKTLHVYTIVVHANLELWLADTVFSFWSGSGRIQTQHSIILLPNLNYEQALKQFKMNTLSDRDTVHGNKLCKFKCRMTMPSLDNFLISERNSVSCCSLLLLMIWLLLKIIDCGKKRGKNRLIGSSSISITHTKATHATTVACCRRKVEIIQLSCVNRMSQ